MLTSGRICRRYFFIIFGMTRAGIRSKMGKAGQRCLPAVCKRAAACCLREKTGVLYRGTRKWMWREESENLMKNRKKTGIRKKAGIFMLALCLAVGIAPADFGAMPVSAAAQTKTKAKKAKVKKNKWVQKNGKWYYYNAKGKMLKNTWKVIKNQYYYFGADGARKQSCWYTTKAMGKEQYMTFYFNSKGVFVKSANTLKSIDQDLVKKMDAAIAGQKITAKTSAEAAVKTLFCLVRDQYGYDGLSARGFKPETAPQNWEYTFAKQMLTNKKGSCYHYAAALAFLVKRATGLPVRIGTGTARVYRKDNAQFHGWVEIGIGGAWYIYDPIVAKNAANRDKSLTYPLYKLPYNTARQYYTATKYFVVNI